MCVFKRGVEEEREERITERGVCEGGKGSREESSGGGGGGGGVGGERENEILR